MGAALPKSWPPSARDVVLDAARYYYRQMKEPWAVADVEMDSAIEWANQEIVRREREIYEEASPRWINRWEKGALDPEMKRAIEETYRRLSAAERAIRPRRGSATMKSPRQLDAEIAEALKPPPAPGSHHATTRSAGRTASRITEEEARAMPRFEFVARWLEVMTRKKENRDLAKGKRVRRVGDRWQILYGNGLVEYETPDADRLFDYARRGPLNWHIRNAEEFRGLAHERAGRIGA